MNRDKQIEFMDGVEARHQATSSKLSASVELKNILRQYDYLVRPQPIAKRA